MTTDDTNRQLALEDEHSNPPDLPVVTDGSESDGDGEYEDPLAEHRFREPYPFTTVHRLHTDPTVRGYNSDIKADEHDIPNEDDPAVHCDSPYCPCGPICIPKVCGEPRIMVHTPMGCIRVVDELQEDECDNNPRRPAKQPLEEYKSNVTAVEESDEALPVCFGCIEPTNPLCRKCPVECQCEVQASIIGKEHDQ